MTEATVLVASAGTVRTITLNRPAALNSLTAAMHGELLAALQQAAEDAAIRAVVITGAGRGFCAGQDLGDPAMTGDVDVGAVIDRYYRPLALRLRTMPVPVVAAVNGVAAGAGANLALCCDFVLAARGASFIQAFSKIGLVPDCGGTWLLPRLVGRARRVPARPLTPRCLHHYHSARRYPPRCNRAHRRGQYRNYGHASGRADRQPKHHGCASGS